MGASAALAGPIPLRAAAAQTRILRLLSLLATHAVLMTGAVFMLLPFVWMLMTSLKSPGEIFSADFTLWPRRFSAVENYDRASPPRRCCASPLMASSSASAFSSCSSSSPSPRPMRSRS